MKPEDKPFVRRISSRFKDPQGRGTMRKLECGHVVVERDGGRSAKAVTALCVTCRTKSRLKKTEKKMKKAQKAVAGATAGIKHTARRLGRMKQEHPAVSAIREGAKQLNKIMKPRARRVQLAPREPTPQRYWAGVLRKYGVQGVA